MIDFVPPERDANVSEMRAMFEQATRIQADAFARLLDNVEQHCRYNEKAVEGKRLVAEIDRSAARGLALTAELRTMVSAWDGWRERAATLLIEVAGVPDRVQELARRDVPHPASVMGRPVRPAAPQPKPTPQDWAAETPAGEWLPLDAEN